MNSLFMGGDDENEDAAENAAPEGDQEQEQEQAQEERDQPVDEAAVVMLTGMGFSGNAARKALILCGGENTERAMDWILEHAGDATIDEPITETELAAGRARREQERRQGPRRGAPARFLPDQDVAARLVDMGFAADQVRADVGFLVLLNDWVKLKRLRKRCVLRATMKTRQWRTCSAKDLALQ